MTLMKLEWLFFAVVCAVVLLVCVALVALGFEVPLYEPQVPIIWVQIPRVFLVGVSILALEAAYRARAKLGVGWIFGVTGSFLLSISAVLNVWHSTNPFVLVIANTTLINMISVWSLVGVQFGFWQSLSERRNPVQSSREAS